MGIAGGAASGAAMGAMLGPIGALAGAAIGGIASAAGGKSDKKKAKKAADEALSIKGRSKASRLYDAFREAQQQKMQSMASLSQAAMDWANMMR